MLIHPLEKKLAMLEPCSVNEQLKQRCLRAANAAYQEQYNQVNHFPSARPINLSNHDLAKQNSHWAWSSWAAVAVILVGLMLGNLLIQPSIPLESEVVHPMLTEQQRWAEQIPRYGYRPSSRYAIRQLSSLQSMLGDEKKLQ